MSASEQIKKRRDELGWTIAKLARESGVNRETIRRIEEGTDPKVGTLKRLARALQFNYQDMAAVLADEAQP